jgi:hypothetical protein
LKAHELLPGIRTADDSFWRAPCRPRIAQHAAISFAVPPSDSQAAYGDTTVVTARLPGGRAMADSRESLDKVLGVRGVFPRGSLHWTERAGPGWLAARRAHSVRANNARVLP